MAEKRNPGARGGAAGAGCLQAAAVGPQHIARPEALRHPGRTRPRGFAPWNPRPESLALVQDVRAVLDEYRAHLPLTLRQCFYRLVATRGYSKSETAYARLGEVVNRARRAGLLPFAAIRDDGGARHEAPTWADPADFLGDVLADARRFRLDRQEGQPVRLWLLCEAAGMAPMLAGVANAFGVPVLSTGGFDSVTGKHDLAREIAGALRHHERAEVLHIGDMDPSGEHIFASLAEDVTAMVRAFCGDAPGPVAFIRLAVTWEQADRLCLPTAPPKPTDRRRFEGKATVQAEALDPATLAELVRAAITARRDVGAEAEVLAREAEFRAALLAKLGGGHD
jgi:hypothetical protein